MKVPVVDNVLKLNDEIAQSNRAMLRASHVFCIDLLGGPGCGKTTLLEATLAKFANELRVGVCVGDLATTRDADRLDRHAVQAVQINTGRSCHLDANQVKQALTHLPLADLDLLIIENVGNLICPVGFDLGQDVKVGMFSLTEGDDKAAKHPSIVTACDLMLLNKMDLAPHLTFDREQFRDEVGRLHPGLRLIELSSTDPNDAGFVHWLNWVRTAVQSQATLV